MVDWQFIRDFTRKHVNKDYKLRWGYIKLPNPHESQWTNNTIDATTQICAALNKAGILFATEVKMSNGRRADILAPELYESQVIEIHDSEGQDSLDDKQKDYDEIGVTMARVSASDVQKFIEGFHQ